MSKANMEGASVDIFQLLQRESRKEEEVERVKLLESIGIKEFFIEGKVEINKRTCKGTECNLCIEACPTNALYWKADEVGIVRELCVYCTACVWSCIVDDCIHVRRKRSTGKVEEFSNPKDVLSLLREIGSEKRGERIETRLEWTRKIAPLRKLKRSSYT